MEENCRPPPDHWGKKNKGLKKAQKSFSYNEGTATKGALARKAQKGGGEAAERLRKSSKSFATWKGIKKKGMGKSRRPSLGQAN